jgi:phage protein D
MSAGAEQHVASYEVLVEGEQLAREHRDRIKEIRVVDDLRLPDVCTLRVAYPRAAGIDAMPFEIGRALEVRLGATDAFAPASLFKGQIVTVEPEFGEGGCSVTIRSHDRSHVLHRSRRVRTFQNQTASDIVTRIVEDAGMTADCEASGEPHDFVQQDNETDWDLIWRLAERVGFEFVVEDTVAHFRRPGGGGSVELEWPGTLRSFRPRVTAVQQVSQVTLLAQDPKSKRPIEVTASRPAQLARIGVDRDAVTGAFAEAAVHVATEPVKTKAEGDALAQALLDKLANAYVGAEGIARGHPGIKAGTEVHVTGVGERFSGTYRVSTSTHVLRGGSAYDTHFRNSPSHTLLGAAASDSKPRFAEHVVIGLVTNNDDPEGMGRVRVGYPALGPDVEGAWARIATPGAGHERGVLMLPVPGEEVLVAFEHGDTTRPYVLGSLFNGRDTPGDDLLQHKDGSFAVRSDAAVFVKAAGQCTITSDGALHIETSDAATVKAAAAIEASGQSVSIKADSDVAIEGATSLTLKCGGSQIQLSPSGVNISGPMITIG